MKYQRELDVALKAIKEASKAVIEIKQNGYEVITKEDNSPVTKADLTSDRIIRKELLDNFKDYGILTEESKENNDRLTKDYCFIVDPIDGTKDFVNNSNNFSINIALDYKNEIVLGLIAIPMRNLIYYAVKGEGAYKIENDKVIPIHVNNNVNEVTMLVSLFFFHDQNKYKDVEWIKEIVPVGSSYKACLIAEGSAEFCIKEDDKTKEWDTAPCDIIVKEAGGYMTNLYGEEMLYNKKDVVNRDGWIICNQKEILEKVKYKR